MKILLKIAIVMFACGVIGAAVLAIYLYYSSDMPWPGKAIVSLIMPAVIIGIIAIARIAIRDINSPL